MSRLNSSCTANTHHSTVKAELSNNVYNDKRTGVEEVEKEEEM